MGLDISEEFDYNIFITTNTIWLRSGRNRKGTYMHPRDLAIVMAILALVTGGFWLWCMKNGDPREMSAMLCFVGTAVLTWNAFRKLKK